MLATGLDEGFDEIITALPQSLIGPSDHALLAGLDELDSDPYSILTTLRREHGPVLRFGADGTYHGVRIPNGWMQDENHPQFIVLGWDALREIVQNPAVFHSGDGAGGPSVESLGEIVTFLDGDAHDKHRRLLNQAFGRRAIERIRETVIDPIALYLVRRAKDRLQQGQPVCFGKDIGLPMAYKTMTSLLGLPHDRFAHFVEISSALHQTAADAERAMHAAAELAEMWREQLAQRRRQPREDLLTWMAQAEEQGKFTDEEVVRYATIFLPAGVDTTSRQIGLTGLALLSHPDQYAAVVHDHSLIDAAIDEATRWSPSAMLVPRRCMEGTVVAGVPIPKLSSLTLWTSIANRDPARFPDPDVFDIHRGPKRNLAFNAGVHHCLGVNLAKSELRAVVSACVTELPELRLAVPPGAVDVRGIFVRSPMRIPVSI
ncbi:cytochrome P450 [Mycobacterium vicinigordonae]|uniref:Cytochrome P450 n=1 Tax=Mycobacterium vicinigordonae TaxID=1719132 RepID=A0A7D6HU04_9MYCO|nr:cytochrome P450 [Mycobacterium vicinigordonae]QLL07392.1 cytochrome P450 [Mycobacterium vicinigordonae]